MQHKNNCLSGRIGNCDSSIRYIYFNFILLTSLNPAQVYMMLLLLLRLHPRRVDVGSMWLGYGAPEHWSSRVPRGYRIDGERTEGKKRSHSEPDPNELWEVTTSTLPKSKETVEQRQALYSERMEARGIVITCIFLSENRINCNILELCLSVRLTLPSLFTNFNRPWNMRLSDTGSDICI